MDDTFLIGRRARELNMLLHAIEEESEKYNMNLNRGNVNMSACLVALKSNSRMALQSNA